MILILGCVALICVNIVFLEMLCESFYFFFSLFTWTKYQHFSIFFPKGPQLLAFCASKQLKLKIQEMVLGVIWCDWSLRQNAVQGWLAIQSSCVCSVMTPITVSDSVQWGQKSLQSRTFSDNCESFPLSISNKLIYFACSHEAALFISMTSIPEKRKVMNACVLIKPGESPSQI